MRSRRLLLAASALSTLTFCKQEPEKSKPLPGNPKGTFYDAAMASPPDAEVLPLPGNPKGTFYDAGIAPVASDAAAPSKDAATKQGTAPVTGR